MANDNHETYGGVDIATYTDDITTQNSFTEDQIMSYVLSAGATPNSDTLYVETGAFSHESATGGANNVTPFYKESNSQILWYDDSELGIMPAENLYRYKHCVYVSTSGNKIASSLKIEKYKIFLSIREITESSISGKTIKFYLPEITLKYGTTGDWTVSALQPAFLYKNTNDIIGAQSTAALITQCNWYWGGANNVQNFLNGWNMFDRNLMYGTDMGGHEYIPWERPGTDPIRIKEGSGATFPCYFENDHFLWAFYGNNPLRLFCGYNNINDILLITAFCGLKFEYNGTTYKPLAANGVVYGYTDDMTVTSEWDEWHDIGDHVIPVTPPTPPAPPASDEDDDTTIPVVAAPYSSGLARYYVTTAGSTILSHISQAMGEWDLKDTGKDLYKNIISCKLIKPPAPIPVTGSEAFTIYGVKPQYQGGDITLPVVSDNPTASFGSYNIPRKFNDFRDYAPYTKVEIYLPYCGWTVLPSHVVGRSVSVTYYTDIIAATCKAVVYCGSNVIAEAAGVIGLDVPMVTENAGAKAEAVSMGLLAYGKAGLQTALGVGAAVATKGKAGVKSAVSGLENLVSAYSQTAMAFNQNYTEINGKNGDGCCIAGIAAIVIKITRPKAGSNTTAPFVPSEYGHSTGFVSMKSATVGSFTGLLVADNVDTSGISGATEREKQLIKLYLESGIYVRHPN